MLAPISFAAANLLVYWSGWGTVWRLLVMLALGFVIMAISLVTHSTRTRPSLDFRHTVWLWPYLIGMVVISYLGQYGGGIGFFPLWIDIVIVIAFSLVIFYWAVYSVRPTEQVRASIEGDEGFDVTELPAPATEA